MLHFNPRRSKDGIKRLLGKYENYRVDDRDLRLLAMAVRVFGPRNYTAIARITGLPVETVRYKIRSQFLRKGIMFQAHVDHGKLGLARYWVFLDFAEDYDEIAPQLLDRLARESYVEYFGRVVPWGGFITAVGLPPKFEKDYRCFLERLVQLGVLRNYDMVRLNWIRYFYMRFDCFDFRRGAWDFSWNSLSETEDVYDASIEEDVQKPEVDRLDLEIVSMLQMNSMASIMDIAKRLKTCYKKVLYHYRRHILKKGLIKNYVINWHGSVRWKGKVLHVVIMLNVDIDELETVARVFRRIPFTRLDSYSAQSKLYLTYLIISIDQLQPMLRYIGEYLPKARRKITYMIIDTNCSNAYAIPVKPFESSIGWTFDLDKHLNLLWPLLSVIKT